MARDASTDGDQPETCEPSSRDVDAGDDGLDRHFLSLLAGFGVGTPARKSVLGTLRADARRGWCVALDRGARPDTLDADAAAWVRHELWRLAHDDADVPLIAVAAEVDAALRLSWIGRVTRVAASKRPTCDLRVGPLNVEVYCPQEHADEERVAEVLLAKAMANAPGPVRVATVITHPTTGWGRKVDEAGEVVRDPKIMVLHFPANALIARVLNGKRDGKQLCEGEPNLLWLDLKHGMRMTAKDCAPMRSIVIHETCYVGTHGIWQAFYGKLTDPLYAERTVLEYPVDRGSYEQRTQGWFRAVPRASGALLSVADGVLFWANPWAEVPLTDEHREALLTLSEVRPEFSWFDIEPSTLRLRVDAELERIAWIAAARARRLT